MLAFPHVPQCLFAAEILCNFKLELRMRQAKKAKSVAVPKARVAISKARKGWQRYLPRSRGHRARPPAPCRLCFGPLGSRVYDTSCVLLSSSGFSAAKAFCMLSTEQEYCGKQWQHSLRLRSVY